MNGERKMTAYLRWVHAVRKSKNPIGLMKSMAKPKATNTPTVLQELLSAIDRKESHRMGWKSRMVGGRVFS